MVDLPETPQTEEERDKLLQIVHGAKGRGHVSLQMEHERLKEKLQAQLYEAQVSPSNRSGLRRRPLRRQSRGAPAAAVRPAARRRLCDRRERALCRTHWRMLA